MEEERADDTEIVAVGLPKGGPSIRLPKRWLDLKRLPDWITSKVSIKSTWCPEHEGWEVYLLTSGEKYPICPESLMICPCGCGKQFRYDKFEQEKLRKQHGNSRGY